VIGTIIAAGFDLVGEIIEAIVEKGDDADDMRLKDIPGWDKLKKSCREKKALNKFRRMWKERHNEPEE
jgi:hypothetical protein